MKEIIIQIRQLFQAQKQYSIPLFLVIAIVLSFILLQKQYIQFQHVYIKSLIICSSLLLHAFQFSHHSDTINNYFSFGSIHYIIDTQFVTVKYTCLCIVSTVILFPENSYRLFRNIIFLFSLVYILNCIRIAFLIVYINYNGVPTNNNHHLIFHIILIAIPLLLLFLKKKIQIVNFFRNATLESVSGIQKLTTKLLFVGFILNLISIIISFFIPILNKWIFNGLTIVILNISRVILSQFGFIVTIHDRYIIDSNSYIYMGDPCLGLYIMMVLIIVPFLSEGRLLYKTLFAIIGICIIIMLNTFRVSLLFAYLRESGTNQVNIQIWHQIYNNTIYVLIFLLWVGWFWIQDKIERRLPK